MRSRPLQELGNGDKRYVLAYRAATTERSEIEPTIGFVSLTITHPTDATRVTVSGEEIRRAAWSEPAPASPGVTEVVVETPGHAPVTTSVSLSPGARTSLTVDAESGELLAASGPLLPPPAAAPSSKPRLRTFAYVAGGIGAAGLLTFAVAGILAHSTYEDLQSRCGGPCPPDKAGEIASGRTQQTVANLGLAWGLVGVATGVTLFVLSLPKTAPASAAIVVSPSWIGLRGSL